MEAAFTEQFVLFQLSLIDMERTARSLSYLDEVSDDYLRDVLFRDAVVCYAKPFSGNNGLLTKRGLKIESALISEELKVAHKEIIALRNQLFAHIDIGVQEPAMEAYEINRQRGISFSIKGYEKVYAEHLVTPLKNLSTVIHSELMSALCTLRA